MANRAGNLLLQGASTLVGILKKQEGMDQSVRLEQTKGITGEKHRVSVHCTLSLKSGPYESHTRLLYHLASRWA